MSFQDTSCGAWAKSAGNESVRAQYHYWFRGFVSGYNFANPGNQVSLDRMPDSATLDLYVDKYCREPVTGTDIWDEVVNEGLGKVFERTDAPRQEVVPFLLGLDRVLSETLMPLAERAGMGRKIGREFLIDKAFWDEFGERIRGLQLTDDMIEARKLFFRECCNTVRILCVQHDPDNARHADRLALFVFNDLNATGALTILERLRTAKPRTHGN